MTRSHSKVHLLAPLLLIPSGCAALIYQVIWVRLLGLSMGSTSAAVSTVLAAFFIGMAVGSYFAGKITNSRNGDLLAFSLLELLIGLSSLVILPLLLNLDQLMALLGESGAGMPVRFMVSLLVLSVPTVCIGATFPVFSAALILRQRELGQKIGWFYALNTFGAVSGAVLGGFLLVPEFGLDGAVYIACGLNLTVALLSFSIRRQSRLRKQENLREPADQNAAPEKQQVSMALPGIAGILFFTGFIAIATEVAWTKYLSIYTGTTLYGFAAILGIFLSGIALGAGFVRRYLADHQPSRNTVAFGLALLGVTLLVARIGLALLPDLLVALRAAEISDAGLQVIKYLSTFCILFPATFVFGGLFPVTLSMYCEQWSQASNRIGRGYAINTLGSILGSVAAGFWAIPQFGTNAVLSAIIVATVVVSWGWLQPETRLRQRAFATALIGLMLVAVWQLPQLNFARLIAANPYWLDTDAREGKSPRFLFLAEGRAGVISLVTYDNRKARLQNNGIQESYIGLDDNVRPPFTEVLLGVAPYLLHPEPKSAFVVGFGGGHTVSALADTTITDIRVVELEPEIVSAVASQSQQGIPVLQDPRIRLDFNDARNALLIDELRYDLIISQPSHPWLAGAGHLFTREYFGIAASRLNHKGIFTQWINLFNMDATTLRSIFQAYFEVFPHGFALMKRSTGDLILIGSGQPLLFDYRQIQQRMQESAIEQRLAEKQIRHPEDLLWYFSMSREEALAAASGMAPNSDTRIISEVRLAGIMADASGEEDPYELIERHSSLDVVPYLQKTEAARMLYLAGRYFYQFDSERRTRNAVARLKTVDPDLAGYLEANWQAWLQSQ